MNKKNIITWAILVGLTLTSYFFSENTFSGFKLALIVMAIVCIKFIGIGIQFMDLKKANSAWKVLFVLFILLFSTIAVIVA